MEGIRQWEVPSYGSCLLVGGVHLLEVSTCGRCPPIGGVFMLEGSTSGRFPNMGGAHLWDVYLWVSVCLWEVSIYERCLLVEGIHWLNVFLFHCSYIGSKFTCLLIHRWTILI